MRHPKPHECENASQASDKRPRSPTFPLVTVVGLCMLMLLGCEESVNPNLGIDQPFTLWGLINPDADTHAVRVFELEGQIKLVSPDPIDAVVTSTNVGTGETQAWQDSVVQLADGDYRHVYWAAFDAQYGETYRLEARRSDGTTSSAEVTVPPPVTLEVLDPSTSVSSANIYLPVAVHGNPPSLPLIELTYNTFGVLPESGGMDQTVNRLITISYDSTSASVVANQLLRIDLRRDFDRIIGEYVRNHPTTVAIELREMELEVHVGNDGWVSPVGTFDPNVLVEPGVLSNVENGFGFLAAGYTRTIAWRPPDSLLEQIGFGKATP